jgi:Leucine-rich repeat (LRR) protein
MSLFNPPAKLAMWLVLSLMLLCYGVGNVVQCATIHENSEDLRSLLDFKAGITRDPYEALSNWTTSAHFCHWNGVTCTTTGRPLRVIELNLTRQNLAGKISSSLGNLTSLNSLDLSYNTLVGSIPPLGHLKQLEILYFNNNNLSGIIPDALANFSNLNWLDLSSNLLVGSIPPKLGLLSNLVYLDLGSNQLEGGIPDVFGQLVNLTNLLLANNMLSGEIPRAIFRLSSLQYLGLGYNMLRMVLPPNMGDLFPNLIQLGLQNNFFEGQIPASLGNAIGLQEIDLSYNNFTGQIPSFGKLSNLTFLSLQYNQLVAWDDKSWEFLNALGNCKSLEMLSLAANNLQGSLPPSIGNLSSTNLQHLLLGGGNRLSGQIPESIGKLSSLIRLTLNDNLFSGTMDGWLENLKGLQILLLNSNNFTGPIPSSISNPTQLVQLDLSDNGFGGPIPSSLGSLPQLQQLNLSNNNLQGYIPQNFGSLQLIDLDLSHNDLEGNTTQIGNLDKLNQLDLSWNKFTGQIPDSLGHCYGLESIKMEQNFLNGSIPSTFSNLTTLKLLNLSHNNLSGTIPKALNVLVSLIKLDLSYNNLHGDVPRNGVFENDTAVSLEGNQGLCGGVMDLHMPPCEAVSKKTDTGYYLIRVLIPIFGFLSLILLVYLLLLVKKMPRTYSSLNSIGDNFIKVSYNDLAQATSNFSESNLVGRGSYGSVYRGKLKESKMEVAVKVFDLQMGGAEKSFLKECEVLRSIQHRNLLPILTACSTVDNTGNVFKALVYSFMANGSLDRWLHHKEDRKSYKPLNLSQRLSISVNMADALDYLHHECGRPTIHCDLKPSNVLLDDDMNALLADFGIASFYYDSSSKPTRPISSSVGVKGTIGYIAPGMYVWDCMNSKEKYNVRLHCFSFTQFLSCLSDPKGSSSFFFFDLRHPSRCLHFKWRRPRLSKKNGGVPKGSSVF